MSQISLLVFLLCHVAMHYHPTGTNGNLKNIIMMNNRIVPHCTLPLEGFIDQITCYHNTKCWRTLPGSALWALSLYKAFHDLLRLPYPNRGFARHQVGMDTTRGKREYGLPQAAPLGAGRIAGLLLIDLKTVNKYIPWVTCLQGSVPCPHLQFAWSQRPNMWVRNCLSLQLPHPLQNSLVIAFSSWSLGRSPAC